LKEPKIIPYQKAYEIFLKQISILNSYAKRMGVRLLVENHVVVSSNLINGKNLLLLAAGSRELMDLYKSVNSDNFGFLVDLGHLKITAEILQFDPYSFIDELGTTVGAFHVSDNEGYDDSHSRFDEKAWFKNIVYKPDTIFIIESCNLESDEIKKCYTGLTNILRKKYA
ncbi:MAG: TIM barrel protein, partial [Candidatus Omnitrophica bacterium]|nr:TIM barrel protein [Candidatus Omnitrophota bacterium]